MSDTVPENNPYKNLSEIFKSVPLFYYIYDLVSEKNIFVTNSISTVLGYTPDEFQSFKIPDIILPQDEIESVYRKQINRIKHSKTPDTNTARYRVKHKDGTWKQILVYSIGGDQNEKGEYINSHGIAIDITKEVEKELFLSKLMEVYPGIIFVTDVKANIPLFIDGSVEKFYGYTKKEMLEDYPKVYAALFDQESIEKLQELQKQYPKLKDQEKLDFNFQIKTKSNEVKDFLTQVTPYKRDSDGNLSEVIGTVVEVTEFRKVQEEKNLIQQKWMESRKLETMGLLASGIAHEFNNLLMIILNYSELLNQSDRLNEQTRMKAINSISSACKRGIDIVNSLFFLKDSSKKDYIRFEIQGLISETIQLLSDRMIQFQFAPSAKQIFIEADKTQIGQVLFNLFLNAIQASEEFGKVLVSTSLNASGNLEIQVQDFGSGIPKEIQEKIFDPFFTTKKEIKGTGMGLSVVQAIVNSHEGKISFQSEEHKGTIFTIELPLKSEAALSQLHVPKANSGKGLYSGIIIEDEVDILEYIQEHLLSKGKEIKVFSEAGEALNSSLHEIDFIICDYHLPKMNGLSFAKAWLEKSPQTLIIIISGSLEIRTEDFPANVVVLKKPFSIKELDRVLGIQ